MKLIYKKEYKISKKNRYNSKKIVNFAFEMKPTRIAGLAVLAPLWVRLNVGLLTSADGFNLKNILIAAMSGIIIFVPLYKKYFGGEKK